MEHSRRGIKKEVRRDLRCSFSNSTTSKLCSEVKSRGYMGSGKPAERSTKAPKQVN